MDDRVAPTRVIVATIPGRFRDAVLAEPPIGAETLPLGSAPIAPDPVAEVVLLGGAVAPIAEVLRAMPAVRWIHTTSAGVERFLVPELVERDDIVFTNSSGAHEGPMAEFVLAAVLAAAKRFPTHLANQRNHVWADGREHGRQRLVRGATVLILGPGKVGAEFAILAKAIGMRVLAVRRGTEPLPEADETGTPDDLMRMAAEADYLVVTAALTPETRSIVSHDVLAALPSHAWVINVARGPLVDEHALLDALRSGQIAGAVLDTLWTEPLPPDSGWWDEPNVVITGHTSSGSAHNLERTIAAFVTNLERYRAGAPLLNIVDKRAGY
ncbi:MAG: D-2-hydroxyacid dehydrogenase [Actinomycetota bacterium]